MKQETLDRLNEITDKLIGDSEPPEVGLSSSTVLLCDFKRPNVADMMIDLMEEQEETLLAVIAAGVPTDCIWTSQPKFNHDRINHSVHLSAEFGFYTNNVYT